MCFQQPLRCYRNGLVTSTVMVQIPCGPLLIVPRVLPHSIMPERKGQNLFFTVKVAFFSKNLCFQQPLRSYIKDLTTSTVSVRIPFGPIYIVP